MQPFQKWRRLTTDLHDDVLVIRVSCANLFDEEAEELRREFTALLRESQPRQRAVLDLSRVAMISSQGVGAVIGLLRKVRENNGELVLCGLAPVVEHVFSLCRLISSEDGGVFRVYPDEAAAVASLAAAKA